MPAFWLLDSRFVAVSRRESLDRRRLPISPELGRKSARAGAKAKAASRRAAVGVRIGG
jgi:hypothetical protein